MNQICRLRFNGEDEEFVDAIENAGLIFIVPCAATPGPRPVKRMTQAEQR